MSDKKVVYLENKDNVDNFLKMRIDRRDIIFISISPAVRIYAEQKGIISQSTLPYFTNASHWELSLISKKLTDWISKNAKFINSEFKINECYSNFLDTWTKFAINNLLRNIEIIFNSYTLHRPYVLFASLTENENKPEQNFKPEKILMSLPKENLLGLITARFAKKENLEFQMISNINNTIFTKINFLKNLNYFFSLLIFVIIYIRFIVEKKIALFKFNSKKKYNILFTTSVSYMNRIAQMLKLEINANLFFSPEAVVPTFNNLIFFKIFYKKHMDNIFDQQNFFQELSDKIRKEIYFFSFRGISFADIIADKLLNNIAPYIIGLYIWTIELYKIIKEVQPSLVISSGNRSDDSIIGELCREFEIPAIFISHGSFTLAKNDIEIREWGELGQNFLRAPFPYIALQSPLAEEYLKVFAIKSKIVKTGPLVWGNPINYEKSQLLLEKIVKEKKLSKNLRIILHAGTPKLSTSSRFHIYETTDEYVQSLIDLTSAVDLIPNSIFIIRFRPSREINEEVLRSILCFSKNVILNSKGSFLDVLGMSNLLVSFSSTTIEEALQNQIPVLLYGGNGRYQHVPADEIKLDSYFQRRAVYHVKEARVLEYAISNILNLNIDRNKDRNLFDQYIYPEHDRDSLFDLIKAYDKK